MIIDWDDAYQNGAYIPDADSFLPMWEAKAAAFRDALPAPQIQTDIPYGLHARGSLDLFTPESTPKGLVVFVHGGYWLRMHRSLWSHLAAGPLANGWAVAMPGYVLAPEASIPEITSQIAKAVDKAAQLVDGPIHLTGHSAGGHLVTRMGCDDVSLACADRIKRILSISGVHDLRPLARTDMRNDLHLTPATAYSESPALSTPRSGFDLTCWVGGDERPEFIRQNALLANIWTGCGVDTTTTVDPGHNHFTVIAGLAVPDSPLTKALID